MYFILHVWAFTEGYIPAVIQEKITSLSWDNFTCSETEQHIVIYSIVCG